MKSIFQRTKEKNMKESVQHHIRLLARYTVAILMISTTIPGINAFSDETSSNSGPLRGRTYTFIGRVDRVGAEEIVVDDHLLYFASSVVYHQEGGKGGLISKEIKAGQKIGFDLNDKKEITDIWILNKGK